MFLMMAASSAALVLVCAVLLGYDVVTSKHATDEHLSNLIQIIADNSKAALSFGDQTAAGEVLATLRAEPHITAACIFDKQGKPFASYHSKAASSLNAPPLRSPGTYSESDHLMQYLPMNLAGEEIGTAYIESDTAELKQRYRSYAGIVAAVMIFSWLASFLVATRMRRTITDPLKELIEVARAISDSGDLEHTIDVDRKDELGDLARSFNGVIGYLSEMAAVSEGIAGGDLSCDVAPRSERDTLGRAFARMTQGLGGLVHSVRQSATQVAGGSNMVASASEDSAKVSVQASSAIDEVTKITL
jgi:methyl-accepting chemotaxis protein